MHPIENLASSLHREFPSLQHHLEVPVNGGNASAWLDVRHGERHVVVEYRRDGTIGVTLLPEDAAVFVETAEVVTSSGDAQRRIAELLTADSLAQPSVGLPGAALTR